MSLPPPDERQAPKPGPAPSGPALHPERPQRPVAPHPDPGPAPVGPAVNHPPPAPEETEEGSR